MDSKIQRFSDRVEEYVKYRPHYPSVLGRFIKNELNLPLQSTVADVGGGTGFFSQLLLEQGYQQVYNIEPDNYMRAASDQLLGSDSGYQSLQGSAEAIPLIDNSVQAISVAQAFHWLDKHQARQEFKRVLAEPMLVMLVWNERVIDFSAFTKAYEQLLHQHCPGYTQSKAHRINLDEIAAFIGGEVRTFTCDNTQTFNWEGLRGRLLSSSYVPKQGANYNELMQAMQTLFETHQENGRVHFAYETVMYYGYMRP